MGTPAELAEQQERDSRMDPHEETLTGYPADNPTPASYPRDFTGSVWVITTRIRQIVNDASIALAEDAIAKAEAKISVAGSYPGYLKKVSVAFKEAGAPIAGAPVDTLGGDNVVSDAEIEGAEVEA
jgi:hypothetical protein